MDVAVLIDCGDGVFAGAEFGTGLVGVDTVAGQVADLAAVDGLEPDETDVVEVGHRVGHGSHTDDDRAVISSLEGWDVLFR